MADRVSFLPVSDTPAARGQLQGPGLESQGSGGSKGSVGDQRRTPGAVKGQHSGQLLGVPRLTSAHGTPDAYHSQQHQVLGKRQGQGQGQSGVGGAPMVAKGGGSERDKEMGKERGSKRGRGEGEGKGERQQRHCRPDTWRPLASWHPPTRRPRAHPCTLGYTRAWAGSQETEGTQPGYIPGGGRGASKAPFAVKGWGPGPRQGVGGPGSWSPGPAASATGSLYIVRWGAGFLPSPGSASALGPGAGSKAQPVTKPSPGRAHPGLSSDGSHKSQGPGGCPRRLGAPW